MLSDGDLLRRYVDQHSQPAFTELVQRHINVVYRTALRRVGGNAHAADDVTQRVFTDLARKASALRGRDSIAGWLYTSTRFAAAQFVRTEQRRRLHEQEAHTMNELNADPIPSTRLEPFIDELIEHLPERDRDAVLLYFFEEQTFAQVALMLSTTADGVRMRVNRALDRMRCELERHGIASAGAALTAALTGQAATASAAPAAATIAARALAAASSAPAGAVIAGKLLALKSSVGAIALTVGVVSTVALGIHAIWPRRSEASSFQSQMEVEQQMIPAGETARPPALSDLDSTLPLAPVTGGGASMTSEDAFADLAPEERNILAMLCRVAEKAAPGHRMLLAIGVNAPNLIGVDPLVRRGFVAEAQSARPGHRAVYLTGKGVEFCAAYRSEIEAYVPINNPGAGRPR